MQVEMEIPVDGVAAVAAATLLTQISNHLTRLNLAVVLANGIVPLRGSGLRGRQSRP
jgi:hypothetical protein